jgi:hypothetical protein
MPLWYYQYVEGRRPDLMGLFPLIVAEPEYANVGRVLDQALASGRPVYLIKSMAGLEVKANLTPEGTLFQATAIDHSPEYLHNAVLPEVTVQLSSGKSLTETIKLLGYDIAPSPLVPGDDVTVTLYWQTIRELSTDYTSYVHLINSDGQGVAQSDHLPGGDFYPSRYWQAGETLRDRHTLTLPVDARPGLYRLRVGMYYRPQPGTIVGMGDGEEIGSLAVE